MKLFVGVIALAATVASLAAPASAGDWNNGAGGIKDHHGSNTTDVPVPRPVSENYQYYFRGDVGVGRMHRTPGMSEHGLIAGGGDLHNPLSTSAFSSGTTSDLTHLPVGLGVGMYLTPRWRADITAETRNKRVYQYGGTYAYKADYDGGLETEGIANNTTLAGKQLGTDVRGTFADKASVRSGVYMLNAYYDIGQRGKLTPYIGFGIGAVHHNIARETSIGHTKIHHPAGVGGVNCDENTQVGQCAIRGTGESTGRSYGLAAALMAGVSYSLSPRTVLDFNYRAQYLQGFELNTPIAGFYGRNGQVTQTPMNSKLTVDSAWEHHLRAGVRVNIY